MQPPSCFCFGQFKRVFAYHSPLHSSFSPFFVFIHYSENGGLQLGLGRSSHCPAFLVCTSLKSLTQVWKTNGEADRHCFSDKQIPKSLLLSEATAVLFESITLPLMPPAYPQLMLTILCQREELPLFCSLGDGILPGRSWEFTCLVFFCSLV